jgi:6-phosphogluconolactonase
MLVTGVGAVPRDVYFGTGGGGAKGIYRAKFDSDSGKLSGIELAAEIGGPGFLARHPDGKHLYAVAGGDVAAYEIVDGGGLDFLNRQAIGDGGAAHVAVHPSGKLLLTAQYGGGSIAVFPIGPEGKVGERLQLLEHEGGSKVVPGRQDSPHPHYCGFSPDGHHAFVPDLGLDGIVLYEVNGSKAGDPTGLTKTGIAMSVPGGGPRHMKFSIDGKFVYLLNELALSVTTFAYDVERATLERQGTVPALSGEVKAKETFNSASEILVHPSGKFVYSANRGNDSVTVYRATAGTGELEVVEVEPIRGAWPRNINLDPSGRWLLAAGANSNTISVFAVDQETGELRFSQGVWNVPGSICILFGN